MKIDREWMKEIAAKAAADVPPWHRAAVTLSIAAQTPEESFEERKFYSDRRREMLQPGRYPSSLPISRSMLLTGLWGIGNRNAKRRQDLLEFYPLPNDACWVLTASEELRQDDQTVFLELVRRAAQTKSFDVEVEPRELCATIGWYDRDGNKGRYSPERRVIHCLNRMRGVELMYYDASGLCRASTSIVLAFHTQTTPWTVVLDKRIAWSAFDATTDLRDKVRYSLPEGLASWLYGWVAAHDCAKPFELATLHKASGSGTKSLKEFGRQIRTALDVIKEAGGLKDYTATRGRITIVKR